MTTTPPTPAPTQLVGRDAMMAQSIKRRYRIAALPDWLADRLGYPRATAFRLQSLSESERTKCELFAYDDAGKWQSDRRVLNKAMWVVASQVNVNGDREWSDDQVETVANLDSGLIAWLVDEIYIHCGVTAEDVEALGND